MSGFNFPPNISGFGRSLMNRASAAGTRLLLQLGDMAIQNANSLGALSVTDTTPSTNTTNGAFTVAGGAGVAGAVNAASFNGVTQSVVGTGLRFGLTSTAPVATGSGWIAQGPSAGFSNTTGSSWIAQGSNAGRSNTTGGNWIAQGASTGFSNTTGSNWIAQGSSAGRSNTTGGGWIAQGTSAGFDNTIGNSWIAQGSSAGRSNTTGSGWIAQGPNAGFSNTTGSNWIAQGFEAGYARQGSNWWVVSNNRTTDFVYGEMDLNNLALMNAGEGFGGGSGILKLPNATTTPTSNPVGSGFLFVEAGALKYRGTSGTVTTIAPA